MKFRAYGHPNITATHEKTFEFTKDKELTLKGDCIIGVNADFSLEEIKPLLKAEKIEIIVKIENEKIRSTAKINKTFCDKHEIVVRKTNYLSTRTLAFNADKVAADFLPLVQKLKNPNTLIEVEINPT